MTLALDELLQEESTEKLLVAHQHTLTPQRPDRHPTPAAAAPALSLQRSSQRISSASQAGPSQGDTHGSFPQTPSSKLLTPSGGAEALSEGARQGPLTTSKEVVEAMKEQVGPRLTKLHSLMTTLDVSRQGWCAPGETPALAYPASM